MENSTIDTYLDELHKKFPFVNKRTLRQIVRFGWRSVYLAETFGADVTINNNDFKFYIGQLKFNALDHFFYYRNKLLKKLKILYKRKKIPWDNYYYFALGNKQWENYLAQKKKRGRPRKYFKFGSVILYKLKAECELKQFTKKYIFRIHYPFDIGSSIFKRDFISGEAEFLYEREPMKFKDMMVSNNKYDGIL